MAILSKTVKKDITNNQNKSDFNEWVFHASAKVTISFIQDLAMDDFMLRVHGGTVAVLPYYLFGYIKP
ncbi:MAG: hypothetical protein KAR30_04115 [Gammaproteobacteria bacterium]|nr:hypothetical protein [Gammaproteobacteria bacterium]